MTLTEFLLDRIDEDEAQAKLSVTHNAQNPNLRIPSGWIEQVAARVLAECEAKRRIVAWASDGEGEFHWDSVLAPLAAVYADHADYDEDWKP